MGGSRSKHRASAKHGSDIARAMTVAVVVDAPSNGAVVEFPPRDPDQLCRFKTYTALDGMFCPMVLPTPELVSNLILTLANNSLSGVVSIGSGGRLDLERTLAAATTLEVGAGTSVLPPPPSWM